MCNQCMVKSIILFISGQPGGRGQQGAAGSPGPQGKHDTNS